VRAFLNVLGVLTLLGSGFALVQARSGEGFGLAFAGLVWAGFVLGLAKVIELLQAERAAADKHRALEVEFWKLAATQGAGRAEAGRPPTAPGLEGWWLADGQEVRGPHKAPELRALLERGTISLETPVCREGENVWRTVREVLR
jgi:hypothetical protein